MNQFKSTLGTGLYMDDYSMSQYSKFISSLIPLGIAGASVNKSNGFPMKGCYVSVSLSIKETTMRTIILDLEYLTYSKEITLFLSRHKSPSSILSELQSKINDTVLQIIIENNLDRDKIYNDNHPLNKIKV